MLGRIRNSWREVRAYAGKSGFIICSLMDLEHGKEWIYTEAAVTQDRSVEKTFDEQYAGGMEFLFPGDEEEVFAGKGYKDHGILWRIPFKMSVGKRELEAVGLDEETGIRAVCTVRLKDRQIQLQTAIENTSDREIPFLARLHPAFCLEPHMELVLNGKQLFFEKNRRYCDMPMNERVDAERLAAWKDYSIFCHILQNRGEFTLKDRKRSISFRYEREKLPYLTVCSFIKDTGRIGIIEPANIAGVSLKSASERGSIPRLTPGGRITYDFCIIPE